MDSSEIFPTADILWPVPSNGNFAVQWWLTGLLHLPLCIKILHVSVLCTQPLPLFEHDKGCWHCTKLNMRQLDLGPYMCEVWIDCLLSGTSLLEISRNGRKDHWIKILLENTNVFNKRHHQFLQVRQYSSGGMVTGLRVGQHRNRRLNCTRRKRLFSNTPTNCYKPRLKELVQVVGTRMSKCILQIHVALHMWCAGHLHSKRQLVMKIEDFGPILAYVFKTTVGW